jgi:5-formyltetrahydrofolate cyclo-ligase
LFEGDMDAAKNCGQTGGLTPHHYLNQMRVQQPLRAAKNAARQAAATRCRALQLGTRLDRSTRTSFALISVLDRVRAARVTPAVADESATDNSGDAAAGSDARALLVAAYVAQVRDPDTGLSLGGKKVPDLAEVDVGGAVRAWLKSREGDAHVVRVFAPHVVSDRDMRLLEFLSVADFEEILSEERYHSAWGLPEPPLPSAGLPARGELVSSSSDLAADGSFLLPHVVVVPGMAFDRSGGRLGRGRGYYDRFLRECTQVADARSDSSPLTIGVGFAGQLVDEVPMDQQQDEHLDALVIDGELILCSDRAQETLAGWDV